MKKLTPKQRAEIYLKAAKKMKPRKNVCYLLGDLIHNQYEFSKAHFFSEMFPEFFMFSPGHSGDWWETKYNDDLNWVEPRIIALLFSYHMALDAKE